MLKLTPVLKNYLWGGKKLESLYGRDNGGDIISESWEVSVHPDGLTKTVDGTLADYIRENPTSVDKDGSEFPILIKFIDAMKSLSVQVHPDDEYSRIHENDNGKTEMWYILGADEGAGIYCGLSRDTTREEFAAKIADGTVEELLNFIPVKEGDCYLIEAGTVHAIGAGCVICEVQQSSNATYRVYDYNRRDANGNLRPLHIEKALDVINFKKFDDPTVREEAKAVEGGKIKTITKCKFFDSKKLSLSGTYRTKNCESFTAINVLSGSGKINGLDFTPGDSFFAPRCEEIEISGTAEIILTTK